ncbi:DUF1667 domain-containing protein [Proteiniclasticum sp. C24MP]|uniref:DUF1667 domain-containing protein n=1 Tax=Proteiniclasticum sp. C24MP TaxID=3374101 RepID=UPI00375445CC
MKEMICIVCPKGCRLQVDEKPDGEIIVMGNGCNRGIPYAKKELTNPTRVITSTVKITGGIHKRLPVKTSTDIPKGLNFDVMRELEKIEVVAPIKVGTVLIKNVLGTGADIVATRNM